MVVSILRALRQTWLLLLILLAWGITSGNASGQMLYKYIDEEGTLVITDNPPPEFTLAPDLLPDVTEEKKLEVENEKGKVQPSREAVEIGRDKQQLIRTAQSELWQAKTLEENYRMNLHQATDYNLRLHWRRMLDKQQKVVEERKKHLEELMGVP